MLVVQLWVVVRETARENRYIENIHFYLRIFGFVCMVRGSLQTCIYVKNSESGLRNV